MFDLDDDLVNKSVKKRRGEVLRAKVGEIRKKSSTLDVKSH